MELRGRKLSSLGIPLEEPKTAIRGHVQNISQGGVCLLSKRSLPPSSVVRGEIVVPGTRAAVPTFLQVRWAQQNSAHGEFKIGLQFLL
jgi:hypothetical protein